MEATTVLNTESQLNTNYDGAQVFLGKNSFENEVYTNATGGTLTWTAGTVMGRISASGKVLPLVAAAVDGSQYPVGVLATTVTVLTLASENVSLCVTGEVASEKLIFNGAETLSTVVDGRQIRDYLAAAGIKVLASDGLTGFDNQ